jgi:hypothetical protein
VEGGGQGLAGDLVVFGGVEGEEVAFGVLHALEFPEDLGDLAGQVMLEGGAGVEVGLELGLEDFVGGVAFAGEESGLGAAVFAGVLGGFGFALRGAGAGGFLCVGAVGGEFFGRKRFVGWRGVGVGEARARNRCGRIGGGTGHGLPPLLWSSHGWASPTLRRRVPTLCAVR